MKISKIFGIALVVGMVEGVSIIMLLNGILGHAKMIEGVGVFFMCQAVNIWIIGSCGENLKKIWKLTVMVPPPKGSIISIKV